MNIGFDYSINDFWYYFNKRRTQLISIHSPLNEFMWYEIRGEKAAPAFDFDIFIRTEELGLVKRFKK